MPYKIRIEQVIGEFADAFCRDIFSQTVEDLDLQAVIKAVNKVRRVRKERKSAEASK